MKFQVWEFLARLIAPIFSSAPSGRQTGEIWYESTADKFRGQKTSWPVDLEWTWGGWAPVWDWKESVRIGTAVNITLSWLQTIDGITTVAWDRVLVKAQTTGSENWIWIAAAWAWARATDADWGTEISSMTVVWIEEWTTLAWTLWRVQNTWSITIWTTALVFAQIPSTENFWILRWSLPPPKYPLDVTINSFDTLQTNFYGWWTVALDTSNEYEWTGSMKLSLVTTWPTWPRLTLPSSLDLTWASFICPVQSLNWTNTSSLEILFWNDSGFTNAYSYSLKWGLVSPANSEWLVFPFSVRQCSVFSGTPNWSSITHILVRGQAVTAWTDAWVDRLSWYRPTRKAFWIIWFDDGLLTQFNNGLAKLNQWGIKAMFYYIWNEIWWANNMTVAMLQYLRKMGHVIGWHGGTNLTLFTTDQVKADLYSMEKHMVDNGLYSPHYSFPNGASTEAIVQIVKKHFESLWYINWWPNLHDFTNNYVINRYSPDSAVSLATMQWWVDNAIATNTAFEITIHGIVASGATGAQILQSNYDALIDYIWAYKAAWVLDMWTRDDYFHLKYDSVANPLMWNSRFPFLW